MLSKPFSVVFLVILAAFSLHAKEGVFPSDMPLKEVSLYSSGVGAFLHEGSFSGEKEYSFRFREKQLNDVLKSLFITGTKDVKLRKVSYPTLLPLSSLLEGFRIPVERTHTLSTLLQSMRGELFTGTLLDNSAFSGRLLAVEEKRMEIPGARRILTKEFITILTAKGLKKIALDDLKEIAPADKKLFAELQEALGLLAGARNNNARDLSITLQGKKGSSARISYVIASPVWKTSYRLKLPEKGEKEGFLQAWALVENPTSYNWKNVKLNLFSGHPVSFVEDLYTSYTPTRPVRGKKEKKPSHPAPEMADALYAPLPVAAKAKSYARSRNMMMNISSLAGSAGSNVVSRKEGALFRYTVPAEVSLESRKSAMLELLSIHLPCKGFTFYAPWKEDKVYQAAYFLNKSRFLLPAGPVTIYMGSSYGGDASIKDLPAGQDILLPFAADLEVKATRKNKYASGKGVLMDAKLVNGLLTLRLKEVNETLYTFENLAEKEEKTLLLEHEKGAVSRLLTKPLSKNIGMPGKNIVQYLIPLAPGQKKEFAVREEFVKSRFYSLVNTGNIDRSLFTLYAGKGAEVPAKFKTFLQALSAKNSAIAQCRRDLEGVKRQLKVQEKNHERCRKTLNSRISENYRNTLNTRLADLDKKIDSLQKKGEEGEGKLKKLQEDLADFLKKASF